MATLTRQVAAGVDDGYWAGSWSNNSSSGGIGKNFFGNDVYSAWRFNNITIPAGATITSATLTIKASETKSDNITFYLYGIDEDDTADFGSDPGGRAKTTANVSWNINGQTIETNYTSADITSIINEILGRAGWASGNDLGIITVVDGATSNDKIGRFYSYDGSSSKAAILTINYTVPATLVQKDMVYKVSAPQAEITKLMRYAIEDPEDTPVPFLGIKIAKPGHNVLNTSNPNNLKFSSDYNTLKYHLSGTGQLHVLNPSMFEYNVTGFITHNLGYYPFAVVYAKDDLMSNYEPLGHWQAGSGAYRQFYFYMTTTRLYFVVTGFSMSGTDDYLVDFYYKIFRNNLNL